MYRNAMLRFMLNNIQQLSDAALPGCLDHDDDQKKNTSLQQIIVPRDIPDSRFCRATKWPRKDINLHNSMYNDLVTDPYKYGNALNLINLNF